MARRRYQDPKPFPEGNFWWLRVWQDEIVKGKRLRKRKRIHLAPVTSPVERDSKGKWKVPLAIRKTADEYLRPFKQGLVTIGSATRFDDYVEDYKANRDHRFPQGNGVLCIKQPHPVHKKSL